MFTRAVSLVTAYVGERIPLISVPAVRRIWRCSLVSD